MNINLVALTYPNNITGCNSPEEFVAYCARVSNPKNQDNHATGPKLIKSLLRDGHWSPLEMVNIVIEINTTRDIARQILRHRSFAFQEFCVAGDTLIHTMTKSGKTKKVPISDLYKRQQSKQYSSMSDWLVKIYDSSSGLLNSASIKEVFNTGIKECYSLVLENGNTITCTEDHKFLTNNGFKTLKDLDSSSFVACNGTPVYRNRDWLEAQKLICMANGTGVQGIADEAGCSYHTIRKWLRIHGLQFSKKETASYTNPWNKGLPSELQPMYGKAHYKESRLKMSETANKGADSNLYINGNKSFDTIEFRQRVAQVCKGAHTTKLINQDYKCNICNINISKETSEIDHILPVSSYPELAYDEDSNLQALCIACHREKTKIETSSIKKTIKYSKIKTITYVGLKQTYDMEIDHEDHNYVANGIITHNSQRYAVAPGFTLREARLQDKRNRQNSLETDDEDLKSKWLDKQTDLISIVEETYAWALENGIAKEQARAILPEGNTCSRLYMNGTLRSWVHYCMLRRANGTQKEHMIIAEKCWEIIKQHFPNVVEACEVGN